MVENLGLQPHHVNDNTNDIIKTSLKKNFERPFWVFKTFGVNLGRYAFLHGCSNNKFIGVSPNKVSIPVFLENTCKDFLAWRIADARDKLRPEYKNWLCLTTLLGFTGRHLWHKVIFNTEELRNKGLLLSKQLKGLKLSYWF